MTDSKTVKALSRANLDSVKFASTDETREYLNGLILRKGKTIASNGHVLMVIDMVNCPKDDPPKPISDNCIDPPDGLLKTDGINAVAKNLLKKSNFPVLKYAFFEDHNKEGEITVSTSNLQNYTPCRMAIEPSELKYESILSEYEEAAEKPLATFSVDPKSLRELCDFWIKHNSDPGTMRFAISAPHGETSRALFIGGTTKDDYQNVKVILMGKREEDNL